MVSLPDNLKSYQQDAEAALNQGAVREIEFSGSTYQVLVVDPASQQEFWVFLQLEGRGEIKDAFCSCDEMQEGSGCLHIAVAYLGLFKGYHQPLHQRFNRSLWNALCRIYEQRLGGDPDILMEESPGKFYCQSTTGKKIFILQALSPDASVLLDQLIHKSGQETEETSLKFSNLSYEELSLWREGKPQPQLRYDLSFWSDLAKWFMKKQEDGRSYEISFRYSKRGLPNWFQIDFEDVRAGFYVSEANLPLVVDSLKTVSSPLAVIYADRRIIERVVYDKKEQILRIEEKKEEKPLIEQIKEAEEHGESIPIEGWSFIPGKGFYADEPHELLNGLTFRGSKFPKHCQSMPG